VTTALLQCEARPAPAVGGRPRLMRMVVPAAALAAAVAVQAWPAALDALQYSRSAVAAGQLWRVWTGSFVHFSWLHLAADGGALAALCCVAAWRRVRVGWLIGLSAAVVGAAVHLGAGDIDVYRGLSGVNCALLAMLLLDGAATGGVGIRMLSARRALWPALLALMFVRAAFETATGRPLLPTSLSDGVAVVGIAHLAGLALGCAAGMPGRPRPRSNVGQTRCHVGASDA